jgi:N-acetylglucosaminyldiphosphoundecaprenol N-acetyl-beta-D-mannosaminyltransferase
VSTASPGPDGIRGGLSSRTVVDIRVDATSHEDATRRIFEWATTGQPAYVCVANVHMTMEAHDHPCFREVVNGADLVVPDGMPLVWAIRLMGVRSASRVRGPDLTMRLAQEAAKRGVVLGAYGGSPTVSASFAQRLREEFSGLVVRPVISPPFRDLSAAEEASYAQQLAESPAKIILVGLGCPKQEKWMARNVEAVGAVLVGVGAAFDFHAGNKREAPIWMQRNGLEWLFRLWQEPRRLWRRYLLLNPRFIALLGYQLLRGSRS